MENGKWKMENGGWGMENGDQGREKMARVVLIVIAAVMVFFLCTASYKAGYMEAYEVGVVVGYAATADVKAPDAVKIYYDQMPAGSALGMLSMAGCFRSKAEQ